MAENATLFLAYGQLQNVIRWWTGSTAAELPLSEIALAAAKLEADTLLPPWLRHNSRRACGRSLLLSGLER